MAIKEKNFFNKGDINSEFSIPAVFLGILISIIFGAANAYLGLRVGMTISASIPAAVISMSVMNFLLRRRSLLESNMVQTIGSAGESLAAGVIFTMPAFFLWKAEGVLERTPSLLLISLIALCGGILGVLFMIPLRNALIVKEHYTLPFPEGKACAEVLLSASKKGSSSKSIFLGIAFSSIFKFIVDGLKIIADSISVPLSFLKTKISAEVYPSLISVGYICGLRVSSVMLAGGIIGWLVIIPLIVFFGGDSIAFSTTKTVAQIYEEGGADSIWSNYIRYIGAGTVAVGGIISLLKSLPMIIKTFYTTIMSLKGTTQKINKNRTEQDIDLRFVFIFILILSSVIYFIPQVKVPFVGAILIIFFGFFFSTVSSRVTGLVGSSNNPISGITIATLIISSGILRYCGYSGIEGMKVVLVIGAIICIIAAIAGDTSQDLKTGFLVGATPRKQQIGEIIGVVVSSLTIGFVLVLLNKAWGFGSDHIPAPQAMLMKVITEGGMNGSLPWHFLLIGGFIALAFEIAGINAVPMAIGLYLPLEITSPLVLGGLVRFIIEKIKKIRNYDGGEGILFCSGVIAGEGLVGILLAVFAVCNININLSHIINMGIVGSIIFLVIALFLLFYFGKKTSNETRGCDIQ